MRGTVSIRGTCARLCHYLCRGPQFLEASKTRRHEDGTAGGHEAKVRKLSVRKHRKIVGVEIHVPSIRLQVSHSRNVVPAVCGQNSKSALPACELQKVSIRLVPTPTQDILVESCQQGPTCEYRRLPSFCAQQTGMHILVVEALLIIYLFYLGSELILIDIRKSYRSSTCLVRYSWSLSS